jgi:MFS family permease
MASLALYRRILQTPQLGALFAAALVARLPMGALSLGLVLFLREESGSFATAGGVAAAFALCAGVFSPLQGRLVDRLGQTRVLVPLAIVHTSALAAVIALALADAPALATGALAALAGAANPPISACLRPLLIELLEEEDGSGQLLVAGYALDSIMIELVFILGPLMTAVFVGAFSPAAAVAAGAFAALAGTLSFASLPSSRAWRGHGTTSGVAGALASPGMRTVVLAALPVGVCFGTLEIVLPAFGAEHGESSLGAYLFVALSLGSIAGGLTYGVAAGKLGSLERGYLLLVAALPACLALLALPDSVALMVVLVPIAGCVIAPLTAAENQIVSSVAPRGAATEAFTWVIMATVVGVAAGNAAAGALAETAGWRAAMLVSCAVAALGALLSYTRRTTLRGASKVAS